jgi:predicted RecB family nuclease
VARGSLLTAADVGHCVHRVALDRGDPGTVEGEPLSTEVIRRIREATQHRQEVAAQLVRLHPDAVVASGAGATITAMAAGAERIFSARLVDDLAGRRTCVVDALVRVGHEAGRARYSPIIIKFNEVIEPAATRRLLHGDLESLNPDTGAWVGGFGVRRNDTVLRNGLTLCHAVRALESLGHEDPRHRAGIIDRQGQLWWFDLDNDDWARWKLSSYDAAYAERIEVLRDHELFVQGDGPFPTVPYWHRECPTCPYSARCEHELGSVDDVSLVRFTSLEQQVLLREHGIATRSALAHLDPLRARSGRGKVLATSGDVATEEYLGRVIDKLDELIYRARAATSGTPLRIASADETSCPTADVEVDVDMESYDDRTYLWGALVTTRRPIEGIESGYRAFVTFDPLSDETEGALFGRFWRWFSEMRALAHGHEASFAAYCFWAHAENAAMNRAADLGGAGAPSRAELDDFRVASPPEWFDLHAVAKSLVQTDGPLGLKALARTAGFAWRDENPSGEASMAWYEEATTPGGDGARRRILEYNEDDCRATRALREWMNAGAKLLPGRDEIV